MRILWLGLGLGLFAGGLHAEDASTTHIKIQDALKNKQFDEDKRITDIELKAQAGSLSRYSLKFDLSFAGPPVNDLSDPEMPNPDGRARNNKTSVSGYVGARYRVNSNEAWNASTGLRWFAPYQTLSGEHVELHRGEKIFDTASPQVSYDHTESRGNLQFRTTGKGSPTTDAFYLKAGQIGSLGVEEFLKYNIGQTRWVAGFLLDYSLFLFNRPYQEADKKVSNYFLSLIPSVEYKLMDHLNFKTSIAYSYSNPRARHTWTTWERQMVSQRVGLGWAITRDIYVNPYLNFFVDHPAINTTSLSMSTVFSIF